VPPSVAAPRQPAVRSRLAVRRSARREPRRVPNRLSYQSGGERWWGCLPRPRHNLGSGRTATGERNRAPPSGWARLVCR
jgi:hypothetical protein